MSKRNVAARTSADRFLNRPARRSVRDTCGTCSNNPNAYLTWRSLGESKACVNTPMVAASETFTVTLSRCTSRFSRDFLIVCTYARRAKPPNPIQTAAKSTMTMPICRTLRRSTEVQKTSSRPARPPARRSTTMSKNTLVRFLTSGGMGR